jgi:hypothetical protein
MDGFHRQSVPQHKGNAFRRADIGEPVPGERAFCGHNQVVAVRGDRLPERVGIRFHVAVHKRLASGVENAHVHRLHVEIDPAIVTMLTVVESHSVLLLREARIVVLRKATGGQ